MSTSGSENHLTRNRDDVCETGAFEVQVAGDRIPKKALLRPIYDPMGLCVRM